MIPYLYFGITILIIIILIIILELLNSRRESLFFKREKKRERKRETKENTVDNYVIVTSFNLVDCGYQYWDYEKTSLCDKFKKDKLTQNKISRSLTNLKKTYDSLKSQKISDFTWIIYRSSYLAPSYLKELSDLISKDKEMSDKISLISVDSITDREKHLSTTLAKKGKYILIRLHHGYIANKNMLSSLDTERSKLFVNKNN